MLLYSHTLAMGVRDHVSCEYIQNNGVIWCIDIGVLRGGGQGGLAPPPKIG